MNANHSKGFQDNAVERSSEHSGKVKYPGTADEAGFDGTFEDSQSCNGFSPPESRKGSITQPRTTDGLEDFRYSILAEPANVDRQSAVSAVERLACFGLD